MSTLPGYENKPAQAWLHLNLKGWELFGNGWQIELPFGMYGVVEGLSDGQWKWGLFDGDNMAVYSGALSHADFAKNKVLACADTFYPNAEASHEANLP